MGARVLSCATAQEPQVSSSAFQNQNTTEKATAEDNQDPVSHVTDDGQIRLLSLSACMMQTFSASFDGGRQNALLAAKRCVRSHGYQWSAIRTCVWDDALVDLPPQAQQVSSFNLLEMKASVCSELSSTGLSAVVCDLAMDEYEEQLAAAAATTEEDVQQPLAYIHYLGGTGQQQPMGTSQQQPMANENQSQQPMTVGNQQQQPMSASQSQQPMGFLNDVVVNEDLYYDE